MDREKSYPSEENLGKECAFCQGIDSDNREGLGIVAVGCAFPKYQMQGRLSCEGIVDDVCLFLKDGRKPKSLTQEQIDEIRYRIPEGYNRDLPPGDVS